LRERQRERVTDGKIQRGKAEEGDKKGNRGDGEERETRRRERWDSVK
jgi:hypothetical protein